MLYSIDAPTHPTRFCASLEVRDGRIVRAAPILGWSIGKPWVAVRAWAERKGYGVEEVS